MQTCKVDKSEILKDKIDKYMSSLNKTFETQFNSACKIKMRTYVVVVLDNESLSVGLTQIPERLWLSC